MPRSTKKSKPSQLKTDKFEAVPGSVGTIAKAYDPTDQERNQLEQKVGDRIGDFYFVETIAAETIIDRTYDRFTKAFLERMGNKYIEGRTMVDSHDTRVRIGKTFGASVVPHPEKTGEYQLLVKFYLSPNTPAGERAINEVKDGIVDRVSVSFRPDYEAVKFFEEGDENSPVPDRTFWQIDAGDPELEEVIELSLVAMGAQPGAKFKGENGPIGFSARFDTSNNESSQMEAKELKITIGGVEKTIEVSESSVDTVETLIKSLSEAKDGQTTAEKKANDLETELKAFREKAAEQKKATVDKLVNLKKSVYGEDQVDAEEEVEIGLALSTEFLEKEIGRFTEILKKNKSLDTSKKEEKKDEKSQNSTGTILDHVE